MRLKIEETNLGACNRLRFMEHYAVIQEGDIVRYREEGGGKAFRFVALAGFCKRVKREFPRDDEFDLAALFEMKKRDRQKGDWGGKRNVRGIVTGMEDGLR